MTALGDGLANLTPRQRDLYEAMAPSGRWMTVAALCDALWGYHTPSERQALYALVHRTRKSLRLYGLVIARAPGGGAYRLARLHVRCGP